MTDPIRNIGFIGIGAMGAPMASRLISAGFEVSLFDSDTTRLRDIASRAGGAVAASPAALAKKADMIVTMLPSSAIVDAVLSGDEGVLKSIRPGAVVVEMSSGVPVETIRLATLVAKASGHLVDAPVSGGVPRAQTGDLTIMLGSDDEQAARVEPVLKHLGSKLMRTGGVGSGHAMKALNNLVSAAGFLIGVEALVIGKKFGLDPSVMVDALNASTGMNNSTQKKFKQYVLSREFNSGFRLDLMVKDLTIALGLAENGHVSAPFAALCREMWEGGLNSGLGPDHTEIAQLSEQLGGCKLS